MVVSSSGCGICYYVCLRSVLAVPTASRVGGTRILTEEVVFCLVLDCCIDFSLTCRYGSDGGISCFLCACNEYKRGAKHCEHQDCTQNFAEVFHLGFLLLKNFLEMLGFHTIILPLIPYCVNMTKLTRIFRCFYIYYTIKVNI